MQVTPVSKVHYRPIEAAIRWLGLLRYESVILAEMGRLILPSSSGHGSRHSSELQRLPG